MRNLKYALIILLVISNSCTKPQTSNTDVYQELEVKPYIEDFDETYHTDIASIDIIFGKNYQFVSNLVGYCYDDPRHWILLKKSYWDEATPNMRKILVFHELGHCAFGRNHKEDTYPDKCPKSFMSAMLMSEQCYLEHKEEILKELK